MWACAWFAWSIISVLSAVTSREGVIFVYCTMQRPPDEEKGVGGQKGSLQPTPQTVCEYSHLLQEGSPLPHAALDRAAAKASPQRGQLLLICIKPSKGLPVFSVFVPLRVFI